MYFKDSSKITNKGVVYLVKSPPGKKPTQLYLYYVFKQALKMINIFVVVGNASVEV